MSSIQQLGQANKHLTRMNLALAIIAFFLLLTIGVVSVFTVRAQEASDNARRASDNARRAAMLAQTSNNCLRELLVERATLTAKDNAAYLAEGKIEVQWHQSLTAVLQGTTDQQPALYQDFLKVNKEYNEIYGVSEQTIVTDNAYRDHHPLSACQ